MRRDVKLNLTPGHTGYSLCPSFVGFTAATVGPTQGIAQELTVAILVKQGECLLEFSNLLFGELVSHGGELNGVSRRIILLLRIIVVVDLFARNEPRKERRLRDNSPRPPSLPFSLFPFFLSALFFPVARR